MLTTKATVKLSMSDVPGVTGDVTVTLSLDERHFNLEKASGLAEHPARLAALAIAQMSKTLRHELKNQTE